MSGDFREIVAALRAVPGVAEAAVQPDEQPGGLGVLRLGLESGADEQAVAGRVGEVLRERFGLGVDADRVRVVHEEEVHPPQRREQVAPVSVDTPVRPYIERMHLVSSGLNVTATVTLGYRGDSFSGEAIGAATQSGMQRAVATGSLRAVEALVAHEIRFELDHLDVLPVGLDRTVVVAVTLLSRDGSERLTGAAAVRDDVRQAVIRATLDAVNRRVVPLLG